MKQVIIIGGGPAGSMAAIACKTQHPEAKVILIERNPSLGVKLRLTGGGRCNITADVSNQEIIRHTPKNGKFLFSSLHQFDTQAIQQFFIQRGCPLKKEDHHRIFPVSNKATDVVDVLYTELKRLGVSLKFNTLVEKIDVEKKLLMTSTQTYKFDHVIFATGGVSYPSTGSDYQGFELIKTTGHTIIPFKPAEVPLVSNETIIQSKALQGLSFKDVTLTAFVNDKKVVTVNHDLLFTHFGLSGPAALQVSSYLTDAFDHSSKVSITIDFLPSVQLNHLKEQLETQTLEEIGKQYEIPKRLIHVLAQDSSEQEALEKLKKMTLIIHGSRGFNLAFVTSGGVAVNELNPKTLQSKIHPSLSFCGEAIDVNSLTGGYNMTVAFSTGYTAGIHALSDEH